MDENIINILGIQVKFPFKAYDSQKLYMKKVIEALKSRQNAILESPTGTGKTLCLLCAVLSWREEMIHLPDKNKRNIQFKVPKVLYASRTHHQLNQVVKELKKTKYKVNTLIQSSRDNLCINPLVQKSGTGIRRVQACGSAVKKNQCKYYCKANDLKLLNNCTPLLKSPFVYDIEDSISIGHKYNICPYYMTRNIETKLDLTLLPYNYLINNGINEINLKSTEELILDNIIIFDEAHNIEKFCEEALSTEISLKDILKCIIEIEFILNTKFDNTIEYNGIINLKNVVELLNTNLKLINFNKSTNNIENLTKTLIENFEYFYENILIPSKLNTENYILILNQIDQSISYLLSYNIKDYNDAFSLHKLRNFIQTIFYAISYIVNINFNKNILQKKQLNKKNISLNYFKLNENFYVCFSSNNKNNEFYLNLQFWCFAPKIAMDIFKKAFCIIVTSGTLSPFDIFLKEIGLSFPIQLENSYIIDEKNLSVNIISSSFNNQINFLFTYNNRNNLNMITQLGISIFKLIENVPDGILIFFPSYTLLEIILKQWKNDGIYKQLLQKKKLVFELKDQDFKNVVQKHHDNIKNNINKFGGSILFGVFRGKISEGINFSDEACRAVIIIGIPYPPQNDPKIKLKKNSLENQETNLGKIWYQHQALRAVNQAIGRVIRHRNDFGMVFLLDERFLYDSNKKCLPIWMQKHVNIHKTFNTVIKETILFFKIHGIVNSNDYIDNSKKQINQNFNKDYLITTNYEINSAMKRLKQVQNELYQKKQSNSCNTNFNLKTFLNSNLNKENLNIENNVNETTQNVKLNIYQNNFNKQFQLSQNYNLNSKQFNSEQEKKLKLFKLIIDNSVCEQFKQLCFQYYSDKNIAKFMDEAKLLLPFDLISQLGIFVLLEHHSIYKIFISKL